jgi:hypothetical protein
MSMTNASMDAQTRQPNAGPGPQDAVGGLDADCEYSAPDSSIPTVAADTSSSGGVRPNTKNETPGKVTPVAVMDGGKPRGSANTLKYP